MAKSSTASEVQNNATPFTLEDIIRVLSKTANFFVVLGGWSLALIYGIIAILLTYWLCVELRGRHWPGLRLGNERPGDQENGENGMTYARSGIRVVWS